MIRRDIITKRSRSSCWAISTSTPRYPLISPISKISVPDTFAKVVFQAVLTGGSKTASAADLIPESLGIYAFVVEMKKEPDGWKVTSATWVRVGEGEGKGDR